mgnify:CR=1 FL=1|jgi:hypothetical protein
MNKISLFIVAVTLTSGCVEVADEHHGHHDRVYVDEPMVVEEPHYHRDRVIVEDPVVVEERHHHHDHVIEVR